MLLAPFGGSLWGPFVARDGGPGRPKVVFFSHWQRLIDFWIPSGDWGMDLGCFYTFLLVSILVPSGVWGMDLGFFYTILLVSIISSSHFVYSSRFDGLAVTVSSL